MKPFSELLLSASGSTQLQWANDKAYKSLAVSRSVEHFIGIRCAMQFWGS